jgi:hypothetical protein
MWDKFIDFSDYAKIMMEGFCGKSEVTINGPHTDYRWSSGNVDLANISIIDMRAEKKMWMMHIACFANPRRPMPIYGFDVICGENKVTGCFHDMSPTQPGEHPTVTKFSEFVSHFVPARERELPPWAKEIFSPHMVVAGATKDEKETSNLVYMGKENLFRWFQDNSEVFCDPGVETQTDPKKISDYLQSLSKYCTNQLMNTNSKNVMISLGLEEDYVTEFKKRQFPY